MAAYDVYAGGAAQFCAVDVEAAAEALAALFKNPDLRACLGAAARARARDTFDWRVVIPQYQALWAELARRRTSAPAQAPRGAGENPWHLDPFAMFAAYPTQALSHADTATLTRLLPTADLAGILARESVRQVPWALPAVADIEALIGALSPDQPAPVGQLIGTFPPEQRAMLERALVWLAKFGLVRLSGHPPAR
jgi:hypothetical protein